MATVVVVAGAGSVGIAGNGRGGFSRGSVRATKRVAGFVCARGDVLDLAGHLFSEVHAARRAGVAGEHGTTGSDARRSGGVTRRAGGAAIFVRDVAPGVGGGGRRG